MNLAFGRCRDINGPLMEAALALYRSSFPAHELRLPPDQRDVMSDPLYHFDMCLLDGAHTSTSSISASNRRFAVTVWAR